MTALLESPDATLDAETLRRAQLAFSEAMPRIERLAGLQHRKLHGDTKDDAVAETIGWAWRMYVKKFAEGEDPEPLLPQMIRFAAGHVRAGKLIGRSEPRADVLSRFACEEGCHVAALPGSCDDEARDTLPSRAPGPVAEAVAKMDYEEWLGALPDTQREVAEGLASGLNMNEVAEKRGTSKTAVQMVRAKLEQKWSEREGYDDPMSR